MNIDFSSDNITTIAPEIMAAITEANHGPAHSYGDDDWTRALTRRAREIFETDLAIYPVATGTAANALALAVLCPPYGGVFCHESAHIESDECGAPEFFSGGAKLLTIPGVGGKFTATALTHAIRTATGRGVHKVPPAAISLSQASEWGTIYTPAELQALSTTARKAGLRIHVDGARFANAVSTLNCHPGDITWRAGVDMLSLGATKNGALAAEAVVIFDLSLVEAFEYRRKRAGQLFSKMRFAAAQMTAYLTEDLWLRHAAQANAMATRLAAGLTILPGVRLAAPVQANECFAIMPERMATALEAQGFGFYRWATPGLAAHEDAIRLVASWTTTEDEVDQFIAAAALFCANLPSRQTGVAE
ncbi:MAG: low specificity L-threonine aldolase [Acidocella sp.]|nr:low specificity L-threonine aldolase [Acidocella sp.]